MRNRGGKTAFEKSYIILTIIIIKRLFKVHSRGGEEVLYNIKEKRELFIIIIRKVKNLRSVEKRRGNGNDQHCNK